LKKLVLIVLLAAVAAYVWLPYYTADRLEAAFRAADKDALDRLVDFPAVRQSLKDQFKAKLAGDAMEKGAKSAPTKPGAAAAKPMEIAPALLTGAVADKVIDSMVTADGVARFLKVEAKVNPGASMALGERTWHSPTEFTATASDASRFEFRFHGLQGWRVVSLEPGDRLGRQVSLGK
jgi:hypothetical protein